MAASEVDYTQAPMPEPDTGSYKHTSIVGPSMQYRFVHAMNEFGPYVIVALVLEDAANTAHKIYLLPLPHGAQRQQFQIQIAITSDHVTEVEVSLDALAGTFAEVTPSRRIFDQ